MDRSSIEAFVRRDWQAVAASKAAYGVEQFQRAVWRPAWNAADALLLDIRRTQPGFPAERDRAGDYASHLKLRAALDCAAHAIARR